MGKIKKWYRSIPIWLTLFIFVTAAILLAWFISDRITKYADGKMADIDDSYKTVINDSDDIDTDSPLNVVCIIGTSVQDINVETTVHFFNVPPDTNMRDEVSVGIPHDQYAEDDLKKYDMYSFISHYSPLAVYSVLILVAGLVFYFTKLRKPLAVLRDASDRITKNELDFTLDYSGYDEMARLCGAFDKMRAALDENNRSMLNMLDERRQLNDAYTHDLRTPIAVLKGYMDMLSQYIPAGKMKQDEILETVSTMSVNVDRLSQFADSMNTVQKLNDISIQKHEIQTSEFIERLKESADILLKNTDITCTIGSDIQDAVLMLDSSAVTQVFENLIANAARFAVSKVYVCIGQNENRISVSVTDDGPGFTDKELITAAKPYYSGCKNEQETFHFGLGLHICRTICDKHGGSLKLDNAPDGGAVVTAEFEM